jgi:hypothetical protein
MLHLFPAWSRSPTCSTLTGAIGLFMRSGHMWLSVQQARRAARRYAAAFANHGPWWLLFEFLGLRRRQQRRCAERSNACEHRAGYLIAAHVSVPRRRAGLRTTLCENNLVEGRGLLKLPRAIGVCPLSLVGSKRLFPSKKPSRHKLWWIRRSC